LRKSHAIQSETGNLYNLEATPAEGAAYRLAKMDRARYPDIIIAGKNEPCYTNSSHLPVGYTNDAFETLQLQDALQCTGGTVLHLYLDERIEDAAACKRLIQRIFERYRLPYLL